MRLNDPACKLQSSFDAPASAALVHSSLPEGDYRRILIKPNWVTHQVDPSFPIEAMVTSANVIRAVVQACLEKYSTAREIQVADNPLQSCDWGQLIEQAGIRRLTEEFAAYRSPSVVFRDLRTERYRLVGGFLQEDLHLSDSGRDTNREVVVDEQSFLDSISGRGSVFGVSDFSPGETTSRHRRGFHRYIISTAVLESELFVNLPKLKTHQEAGITGALKNLVGTTGQKACLAHYRKGMPRRGGDEFPPDVHWLIFLQSRVRARLQKRSRMLFRALRPIWLLLRKVYGISSTGERERLGDRFYTAGGAWYGNDTVWRMVYDLNRIVRYAPVAGGPLKATPQRDYVAVLDGITAGEGNGPLQPLPVNLGVLMCSSDPFAMDMVAARIMGFDWTRIPQLRNFRAFGDPVWANFEPDRLRLSYDGRAYEGIGSLPVLHRFVPPPGWRGHVELSLTEGVGA